MKPTDEQLRACFELEMGNWPSWPKSFEEASSNALVLALLQTMCRHPEMMRSQRVIPTMSVPVMRRTARRSFDPKKLAANDRDD